MRLRGPIFVLAAVGLIPALAIAFLIRLEEGQLIVAGQALAEYDLARLMAGLSSTMRPIWLLAAPALAWGTWRKNGGFWLLVFAVPFIMLGPGLLAGLIVGGDGAGLPLAATCLLGLMTVCFVLWCNLLERFWGAPAALALYGAVWAASGYLGYLTEYILPYLEIPALKALAWLTWLLPQLQSGPDAVDNFLQAGLFQLEPFLPTLMQLPALAFAIWYLHRRPEKTSEKEKAPEE